MYQLGVRQQKSMRWILFAVSIHLNPIGFVKDCQGEADILFKREGTFDLFVTPTASYKRIAHHLE